MSKSQYSQRTRRLAISAMLSAISIVLGLTPLGLIPIAPGAAITTMHIPVIIGAVIEGPLVGLIVGSVFGLFTWIRSFFPAMPTDIFFQNPIISVLPRLLIGPVAWGAGRIVELCIARWKNRDPRQSVASVATAALIGSLMNTVGVLGLLYLIYAKPLAENFQVPVEGVGAVVLGIATTNGIPEVIASLLIVLGIWRAVAHGKNRKKKTGKG